MIKQYIFTLLATLFFTQAGIAQSTGTFTDSRDGQTYKTISFKNALTGTTVTWMAQNLGKQSQASFERKLANMATWQRLGDEVSRL